MIYRWIVLTFAVALTTVIIPGVSCTSWVSLIAVSTILGLINALVKPVVELLTLPLIILTLGLFLWLLNALFFYFAAYVVPGFVVESLLSAFGGALVISLITGLFSIKPSGS